MTADTIVRTAESFIGIAENGNNNVVFNTEYYGREVNGSQYPWCCVFVWYVFKKAGASSIFFDGKKTAYCPTLLNWAKQKNQTASKPQKGDVAFFNFNGKKTAAHVGIVEAVSPDGTLLTIEGNTSAKSNTNGGEVAQRSRKMSNVVGIWRPAYNSVIPSVEPKEEEKPKEPVKEEIKPMPAEQPKFKPYAAVVKVNHSLNVRTSPEMLSNNFVHVGNQRWFLPNGMVIAIDEEKNGFGRLQNMNAWVSLTYLQK